jgi:hypothetical protein
MNPLLSWQMVLAKSGEGRRQASRRRWFLGTRD